MVGVENQIIQTSGDGIIVVTKQMTTSLPYSETESGLCQRRDFIPIRSNGGVINSQIQKKLVPSEANTVRCLQNSNWSQ